MSSYHRQCCIEAEFSFVVLCACKPSFQTNPGTGILESARYEWQGGKDINTLGVLSLSLDPTNTVYEYTIADAVTFIESDENTCDNGLAITIPDMDVLVQLRISNLALTVTTAAFGWVDTFYRSALSDCTLYSDGVDNVLDSTICNVSYSGVGIADFGYAGKAIIRGL